MVQGTFNMLLTLCTFSHKSPLKFDIINELKNGGHRNVSNRIRIKPIWIQLIYCHILLVVDCLVLVGCVRCNTTININKAGVTQGKSYFITLAWRSSAFYYTETLSSSLISFPVSLLLHLSFCILSFLYLENNIKTNFGFFFLSKILGN